MNPETLTFAMSLSGFIIILLLGIIGYFFRQTYATLKDLVEIVNNLKMIMNIQKNELSNFKSGCTEKHHTITHRLNTHADRLDDHGNRITAIEAKTKKE